jgi:hypothetical protein
MLNVVMLNVVAPLKISLSCIYTIKLYKVVSGKTQQAPCNQNMMSLRRQVSWTKMTSIGRGGLTALACHPTKFVNKYV